jgi:serine/threonine-protein kinase
MPEAGSVITLDAGSYRLCAPLAGSAYGVVWRADVLPAGPQVALKLINLRQMGRAQPEQRERWIASADKEIAFLRSLEPWDERHIVRLLDSGIHDGLPVMALELLDGDLGRHVARERAAGRGVGFAQALSWLAQINQALAKVHQYGWRYLDLKPSNVLLDARRGSVKLADFGTNRLLGDRGPHSYAGTANWQAPEQFFPDARQAYLTDAHSDYFALGALFYYLVTGGLPLRFCSECGQAYREHKADGAALLLERHGGVIPPALRDHEAALFVERIGSGGGVESTWCPAGGDPTPGGAEALVLLRSLLSIEPAGRPPHAIAISRMIADIRAALRSAAPQRPAAILPIWSFT